MHITRVPNEQIRAYLEHVGAPGVFARYLAARQPVHASLAVFDSRSKIIGAALSGRECNANEVASHWVFAGTRAAAHALAEALNSGNISINFPLLYHDLFRAVHPECAFSIDRFYLLPPSRFKPLQHPHSIVKLEADRLRHLHPAPEMQPLLGSLDDWTMETELYGVVHDSTLVAIGDLLVQDTEIAVIQQVYTLNDWRGQGIAQALVSFLAGRMIAQGKAPGYVVAEDNLPSLRIVEKLGFELDSRWGYLTS